MRLSRIVRAIHRARERRRLERAIREAIAECDRHRERALAADIEEALERWREIHRASLSGPGRRGGDGCSQ